MVHVRLSGKDNRFRLLLLTIVGASRLPTSHNVLSSVARLLCSCVHYRCRSLLSLVVVVVLVVGLVKEEQEKKREEEEGK